MSNEVDGSIAIKGALILLMTLLVEIFSRLCNVDRGTRVGTKAKLLLFDKVDAENGRTSGIINS